LTYTELKVVAESSTNHVNNVKLMEYLDQARKEWYGYCILHGVEAVVVHISASYKKEVFHDNNLAIQTVLERVGNSSFTLMQTMVNDQGELVVSAEVVLAAIIQQTRTKTRLPDAVRCLLDKNSSLNFNR
jgi:YbgC/YbaW family acyl-CoA thioester hydrolase